MQSWRRTIDRILWLGLALMLAARAPAQSPYPAVPPRVDMLPPAEGLPPPGYAAPPGYGMPPGNATPPNYAPQPNYAAPYTGPEVVLPPEAYGPRVYASEAPVGPWTAPRGCPHCQPWTSIYQGSSYGATCNCPDRYPPGFSFDAMARSYYANDQRIKWTGLEDTFGVEGVFAPRYVHRVNDWTISTNAVFFLNQPYDRNILVDPQTRSYVNNWQVDIFQIWQMNIRIQRGDFTVTIGKDNTPFGRYYFPLFSNSRLDAPFIRSDVIRWNETGIFFKYTPGIFVFDAAITNGGFDRDTNSSKAFVGRAGIDTGWYAGGFSVKVQDGIGSEFQKTANSHIGADAMVRWGNFDLSGEVIVDQYGLYKNSDPNNIFYGRSIYYRDVYGGADNRGVYGVGYYINLGWTLPRLRIDLNYGEYYPEKLGLDVNDAPIRRGMLKGTWLMLDHLESYSAVILENNRPVEAFRSTQNGFAFLLGAQVFY